MLLAGSAMGSGPLDRPLTTGRPRLPAAALRGTGSRAGLEVHDLLCKTTGFRPLRQRKMTSTMILFSLGLVPAQAFRASRSRRRLDGSDKTENRYRVKT